MPHTATGPNGEQLVWMGEDKGWMPMPMTYGVKPASNQGATTPEDAITMEQAKDTAKDVIKSGGIGLAEGGIGLAGLPADAKELGAQGYDYAKRTIADWTGQKPGVPREPQEPSFLGLPGSQAIKQKVEKHTGPFYEPQTGLGELAKEAGQIAPAVVGGGGALVGVPARLASYAARAGTRIAAPMAASHAVGDFLEGSPAAPYAKIGASMVAPTAARKAITPFIAKDAAHVAQADLLSNAGLNVSAGRRTFNPMLNALEEKATFPERFSEANNDKAMAAALLAVPGRSKAAVAQRKELKGAHKDVLEGEPPKAPLDKSIQGLLTLGGAVLGGSLDGDFISRMMHGAEMSVAGHLFPPAVDYAIKKIGKPALMNPVSQKYLGNQMLGEGTHNNPQWLRALLYSTPERLPQELPPIDVNAR